MKYVILRVEDVIILEKNRVVDDNIRQKQKGGKMMNLIDSIDLIIRRVNSSKKEPEFSKEIEARLQRSPEILNNDKRALKEFSILIAYSQNAKSNLVSDMLERNIWEDTFNKFEVDEVAKMNANVLEDKYWNQIKVIRFRQKIRSIIGCAISLRIIKNKHGSFSSLLIRAGIPTRLYSEEHIERFWEGFDFLKKEFRESDMPFFRQPTSLLHLLLHLGYDCVKPDIIVMKVAKEFGIVPSEKGTRNLLSVVRFIQTYCVKKGTRRIRPSIVDLYFMIYGGQSWARQFVNDSFYSKRRA